MCSGVTLGAVGVAVKRQARTPKSLVLWLMVSMAQLVPGVCCDRFCGRTQQIASPTSRGGPVGSLRLEGSLKGGLGRDPGGGNSVCRSKHLAWRLRGVN